MILNSEPYSPITVRYARPDRYDDDLAAMLPHTTSSMGELYGSILLYVGLSTLAFFMGYASHPRLLQFSVSLNQDRTSIRSEVRGIFTVRQSLSAQAIHACFPLI